MRVVLIIFGIVLAAAGGVIAYRALFLEPSAAIVISESGVRELPDYYRVVTGIIMMVVGAAVAVTKATRRK